MVTRSRGTAIMVRIIRMAVATINSISVKPRVDAPRLDLGNGMSVFISEPVVVRLPGKTFRGVPSRSLNGYRRLRAIHGDRLQSGIARPAAGDGQRSLPARFSLERHGNHRALARHTARSRRTRGRNVRLSDALGLAMTQGNSLPILRKKPAVRDIDQLQHLRIVVHLHGHGIDVL